MMNRQINYRLLFSLLAVSACGVGVAFLAHAGQMRRHAHILMDRAQRAEAEGHLEEAMLALQRYLVFAAEDNAARARCGEIVEQLATSDRERWRAVELYEQVLYREPSRQDIRRRLAKLALALGWIDEARTHLEILVREQSGQADLESMLGQCQEEAGDFSLAAVSYENAIRADPQQLESYVRLALLLRYRLDQPEKARRVLDDMVRRNGHSAEAHLARALQGMERGALVESERDMQRAGELAPADSRVLLTAAELAGRRGHWDEARRRLRQGIEREPNNPALHLSLAALEVKQGRPSEAVACLHQGLQTLPDHPDLLLMLAETLLEIGDEKAVEQLLPRLHRPNSPPGLAHYLDGRLAMHRTQWTKAIRIFEEVAQSPDNAAALASRAGLALARCHEQRGDGERQLEALRRAVSVDEACAPARLAWAEVLQNRGRIEEALQQYREVVQLPQASEESWILLGRLLVQYNRSLPARKRRWKEVENVVARAEQLPALTVPLAVLRAEIFLEQDRAGEAQALLEKTAKTYPDAVEPWVALSDLLLRQGAAERSLQILQTARQRLPHRRELYEAEIPVALTLSPRHAKKLLQKAEAGRERLSAEDRSILLSQLAAAYFRLGETAEGRRLCGLLMENLPAGDLPLRRTVLDLAVQVGDEVLLAQVAAELHRLEGEDGLWWRYGEAARCLMRARLGDSQERGAARERVLELVRRRPDWPRGALLQAYLHEQEGEANEAANAYLRAFRGGERRLGLAEHLANLLVDQGRLDEADEVVRQVQQQARPSPELARLGAEIALRQRGYERTLELARLAVPQATSDYPQLIWLGQVLTQAGRPAEGEEALRQAIRRRGDLAETWLALFAHLVKLRQLHEAEELRQEMQRTLPADQVSLALAIAAEVTSKWDDAERYYRRALERTPDDALVLQRAARFYVRLNRREQAEPLLRRLLSPEADVPSLSQAWARRQLALLLAFAGGDDNYRRALALLPEKNGQSGDAVVERRTRLLVQATGAAERASLLRQVEDSAKRQPLTAEELFCLVRLYEAEKDDDAAEERMLDLLTLERNNPEYLAHHIERLLQRGRKTEARSSIARLRKVEGESARVQTFAARLRKP